MAVIRVNKTKDYTIMSNYHFKEKEMSLKAKGLLSEMLSLPENWDYSIEGLVAINKENESAIKSTLDELKEFKYLKISKLMPNETNSGRIEYIYDIFEQPYEKQDGKKQEVENLGVEFLEVENPLQYNINNKCTNNKINNNKKEIYKERFTKPTLEEVKEYCRGRENNVDAEKFINFYEAKGWMIGKSKMKDWKACVRTWEAKDKQDDKKEELPDWFDKDIETTEITDKEKEEFENLLKSFS